MGMDTYALEFTTIRGILRLLVFHVLVCCLKQVFLSSGERFAQCLPVHIGCTK